MSILLTGPESVQTPREVYDELKKEGYRVQYYRLPLTDGEAPKESIFDVFYSHVKDVPPSDALIFNCQMGGGRTTTGMVIGCLIRMHTSGSSQSALLPCCVSPDHRPRDLVDFCIFCNGHRCFVRCGKPACVAADSFDVEGAGGAKLCVAHAALATATPYATGAGCLCAKEGHVQLPHQSLTKQRFHPNS